MSRSYSIVVEIDDCRCDRVTAIKEAAEEQWPFEDWQFTDKGDPATLDHLWATADDQLTGGETERQFGERLARAIWRANEGFCEVTVTATYLEDLPHECYFFERSEYDELMAVPNG